MAGISGSIRRIGEDKSTARICPDCGQREVEYRCQYCSECSYVRRQVKLDIYRHNWLVKNPNLKRIYTAEQLERKREWNNKRTPAQRRKEYFSKKQEARK